MAFGFRLGLEMQGYLRSWVDLSCRLAACAVVVGFRLSGARRSALSARRVAAGGRRPEAVGLVASPKQKR